MLNETALCIAYPHIMVLYNISAGTVQWLTTIFVLISGIVFLMSAFLIQRFTTRKLFLSSMVFLILGTIIAGFSPNFQILMISRVIQAIGTGILVPLIFNSVLILIPHEKRGLVMGLVSFVVLSAPMFSPVLMGFLIGIMDWHWFFLMVFIFFIATTIMGVVYLRNITEISHTKLDVLSVLLAAIGFTGIITCFSNMGENGWSLNVILPLIIGIITLIGFIIRQLKMEHPFLNIRVFKHSFFSIGVLINVVNIMIIFAMVIILPMYLQNVLGTSSFVASLVMLPGTALGSFLPLLSGHIYDKKGPRIVICTGIAIMCFSMILLSHLSATTTLLTVLLIICVLYLGSAMLMSPNQTHTLGNLESKEYASGSAIMTALQQIGGAVGSSLFVSFMTFGQIAYLSNIINPNSIQQLEALLAGINFSFTIGAIILGIAFVFSLFLKKRLKLLYKILFLWVVLNLDVCG
ncbi:MAG: DHA2 family efflux MFS transporter permease subunit [Methanobacterium sp. ERen5]|nr:MAG: DHA2 family efflux MFS transporter permease subunit [Methanobacterium sp. ERen5]